MSDEKPCPFCDSDNVVVSAQEGIKGISGKRLTYKRVGGSEGRA